MSEEARELLRQNLGDMSAVVERYPLYLPILAAAELLHMKPEALRASIEQGKCPFGFCWRLGGRTAYKLPTITFVNWLTAGAAI